MAATQILAEDSENPMGRLASKPKLDPAGLLDMKKDNVNSVASSVGNKGGEGFGGISILDNGSGRGVLCGSSNGLIDKVSDGDISCTGNVQSDGNKWKERERIIPDVDLNVKDPDHIFRVGDFVWGKIKSHPWWPGQVYDPSDASEYALKHSQEGRVLVAFFGVGYCSWCLPSQLVPFLENLEEMSADSSSNSFVNAVQMAVDEIGRAVESKITCKCIPLEKRDHLSRPMVANAGVKEGVLVPEVDIDRLPIPEFESSEILAKVTYFATSVSVGSLIDVAVLRSWLSSYYNAESGCRLCVFSEPLVIEGLEDRYDWEIDVSIGSHVPKADDKVYQRRKKKSVAELIGKKQNRKKTDDEGSSSKRRTKSVDYEVGKRGSKRRFTKEEMNEVDSNENVSDDEFKIVHTPRERKKSKYLSPPFTNIRGRIGNSKIGKVTKLETDDEAPETLSFSASDVDIDVHELLVNVETAAVDHFYLSKNGFLDSVWAFISAHRSRTSDPAEEGPFDDLILDIKQKVDIMTEILENNCSKFSLDEKSQLRDEMKGLLEKVEKVRVMAVNYYSS